MYIACAFRYATVSQSVLENNQTSIESSLERVFDIKPDQAKKLFTELMQCMKKKDLVNF